jgi:hypothetical protein
MTHGRGGAETASAVSALWLGTGLNSAAARRDVNSHDGPNYTVPPGKGLPVWRGTTASQVLKDKNGFEVAADAKGNKFWLEGGGEQLVVNPADLSREFTGKRQFTGWGYDEGAIEVTLVGVPILQTNWR